MRLLYMTGWSIVTLCLPACAEVRLAGRVTNETNAPVAGARVTIEDAAAAKSYRAISDPTGSFQVELPAPGSYSLKVDHDGFYIFTQGSLNVPATPADSAPFEVHIALESTHEMHSSIQVKGNAGVIDMDRVAMQTTLSSRTLYDVPFPNQNNLRSGLRLAPEVIQDSSGGIHLFGGSEDQAEYNFEGFQLNDPLTGRFDARMSLESVQSVDVQASPSGAEMGWGGAGTMTLHARTGGDEVQYSITSVFPGVDIGRGNRFSSWTPRGTVSGPWLKGRAWYFNTVELQFVRTTIPQLPTSQDAAKSWRFNDLLHNQINLSETNILFVGLLFDHLYSPQSGLTLLDPRSTTVNRHSTEWFGYVKDQHSFSHSSMIEFGVAASLTYNSEAPQGDVPYLITPGGRMGNYYGTAHRDAERQQGLVNYYLPAFHWLGSHQLKTGADVIRLDYEQNISRSEIEYLDNGGDVIRAIQFAGPGSLSRAKYESAFYLQDSWRVKPWLLVDVGFRVDGDHLLGHLNPSPRAGFALTPPGMENTRFSGGFARIFDLSNLRLFTRPLDQQAISTYYDATGSVVYGPVTSVFNVGPHLQDPHSDVWTLGAERVLPKSLLAKLQLIQRSATDGLAYQNGLPLDEQLPAILAGAPNPGPLVANYMLTNQRQDKYDAVEISLQQPLRGFSEWMVSYTRSRAVSNAVIEQTIDQPLSVSANNGALPWNAPNRFLSWGYVPVWWKNWAVAYMLDWHSGLPFSIQNPYGQLVGNADDHHFQQFFELNLFVERRLTVQGYHVAVRAGLNNLTGHFNPNVVDNVVGGPTFLREYGGQARALNFRLLFLGKS